MKLFKILIFSFLGIFLIIICGSIYANSIHNQYFSSVAKINRNIEKEDSCRSVYSKLDKYRESNSEGVFIGESPPSEISKWQNKKDIETIISLNDDTTPFDMITFYVLCGKDDKVLRTYLVGD